MTLIDSTTRALESGVQHSPEIAKHLPAMRRLAAVEGKVPSIRTIQRLILSDFYDARDLRNAFMAEAPTMPVSGGAPEYDAFTEVTGAYPTLPGPLPARTVPEARPGRHRSRVIALAVPLLLVNSAALFGQAGWAHDHLTPIIALDILFAAAVESIGVYLAAEAHGALMAGDASARLRLGSYLIGVLVGALNYAHFASAGYRPNAVALTFGLLSSISPWLWAIRSRSMNRDRLRELGQIDPRAVRFSLLRWFLFPLRTFPAFRGAVWAGIVQPAEAIAVADEARAARRGGAR